MMVEPKKGRQKRISSLDEKRKLKHLGVVDYYITDKVKVCLSTSRDKVKPLLVDSILKRIHHATGSRYPNMRIKSKP